jgi:type IV pilus secretin PilQ/predicted competence protein
MGGLTILSLLGMMGSILSAQEKEVQVIAPNAVEGIEVVDLAEKVRIIITTALPAGYEVGQINKEKMFYIDLLNSEMNLPRKWKKVRVKKGAVKTIRSRQHQVLPTKITRVVVKLDEWVKHEVAQEENKLYLEFYKPEALVAQAPIEEELLPIGKEEPVAEAAVTAPAMEEVKSVVEDVQPIIEDVKPIAADVKPVAEAAQPASEEEMLDEEELLGIEEEKLISLNFIDAPMSAVLNFLSEMSGYNIVATPEVTDTTVTIHLDDVPVMTALDTILEMQGLWYKKVKNIVRIMTIEEFQDTLAVKSDLTRVFTLQYAEAETLSDVLNDVLGGAKKTVTPRGVDLGGASSSEAIALLKASKNVVFTGKTFVVPEIRTNSLIVTTDDPRNFLMLEGLIKELDSEVPQILLEAAIVEVTLSDESKFGVSWLWKNVLAGEGTHNPAYPAQGIMDEYGMRGTMRWDEWDSAYRDPDIGRAGVGEVVTRTLWHSPSGDYKLALANRNLTVLLQALASTNKVDVLSSPRILTLDNMEALIQVGQEYPVKISWDEYTYRDLGVILNITPKINKDQFVNISVKHEITEYAGDSLLSLPIFDKRVVESNALVKNGYTMVIGGMIKKRSIRTVSKIPLLGDIPILKYLFSRRGTTNENIELMVLITPHVITTPGEGTRVSRRMIRDLSTDKIMEQDVRVPGDAIEVVELEEAEIATIEEMGE